MMYDIRFGLDCDKSVEGLLGPGKKVLLVDDDEDVLAAERDGDGFCLNRRGCFEAEALNPFNEFRA